MLNIVDFLEIDEILEEKPIESYYDLKNLIEVL